MNEGLINDYSRLELYKIWTDRPLPVCLIKWESTADDTVRLLFLEETQ